VQALTKDLKVNYKELIFQILGGELLKACQRVAALEQGCQIYLGTTY
jgi:hypothetical protein